MSKKKEAEKKFNRNWQQEDFRALMYASFLFNGLVPARFSKDADQKTRTKIHGDGQGYYFNLTYRLVYKEDLFEQLKPIAYQQLQQLSR